MGREWQKFHNLNFANDTISVQNEKELYFDLLWFNKSSVIRQKGESHEHFLPSDTHTYVCVSGSKKCSLFGKFVMFCFLVAPVLRVALLPYYRRNTIHSKTLQMLFYHGL